MVMKFVEGEQLGIAVRQTDEQRLPEALARRLFRSLLMALDHIHRKRIIHRDVKPENVLVTEDFADLKLIDFNIGRYLLDGGALSPNCTPAYAPPEIRRGVAPAEAADIWGAGLCLCVMLTGQCAVHEGKVDTSRCEASDACRGVLASCLASNHLMRPAAMTLLEEEWVQGCNEDLPSPQLVSRRNSWPTAKSPSSSSPSRGPQSVNRGYSSSSPTAALVQTGPLKTSPSF